MQPKKTPGNRQRRRIQTLSTRTALCTIGKKNLIICNSVPKLKRVGTPTVSCEGFFSSAKLFFTNWRRVSTKRGVFGWLAHKFRLVETKSRQRNAYLEVKKWLAILPPQPPPPPTFIWHSEDQIGTPVNFQTKSWEKAYSMFLWKIQSKFSWA